MIKLLLILISTVAPKILDPPDDLTVVEPQDATFSCLATGRPRPDIVWIRLSDMEQLQSQSANFMIEEQEVGDRERRSNLTILDTQPSDAGAYACVAVNEPGGATRQATLTVHGELHRDQFVYVQEVTILYFVLDLQWFQISPSHWMVSYTLSTRHTQ